MKSLYLVRGLQGAGKSSFARHLPGFTFSADDYFMKDGKYCYVFEEIAEAHAACQKIVRETLQRDDTDAVAVANTFSQRWELEPYFQIAAELNATVFVIDLYDGGLTDEQLFQRNVHQVPLETIKATRKRWEHDWKFGDPRPPWLRNRRR